MPGFNQKGTKGQGPMTGRRMGRCTNFGANQQKAEAANDATNEETTDRTTETPLPEDLSGRVMGLGRGRGMGIGRGGMGQGFGRQNRFRGRN